MCSTSLTPQALTKVDDHGKEGIHFGPVAEPTCQAMAARVLGCQVPEIQMGIK